MNEIKDPRSYPILSATLRGQKGYPTLRRNAIDGLLTIGRSDVIPLLFEWEEQLDGRLSVLNADKSDDRAKLYVWNLGLLQAIRRIKPEGSFGDGKDDPLLFLALEAICQFKFFLRVALSLKKEGPMDPCQGIFSLEAIQVGAQCKAYHSILISPGRIFVCTASPQWVSYFSNKIPNTADAQETLRILRMHGVELIEVDYLNPDKEFIKFLGNQTLNLRDKINFSLDLTGEEREAIAQHYLASILKGIMMNTDDVIDLCYSLSESLNASFDFLSERIDALAQAQAAQFLSLFPKRSNQLLYRIILNKVAQRLFANNVFPDVFPIALFFRTDLNFDLLCQNLPYLFYLKGHQALIDLNPGDEYTLVPQFKALLSKYDFGKILKWKKIRFQSDVVRDFLFFRTLTYRLEREVEFNAWLSFIPYGKRISYYQANILQKLSSSVEAPGSYWTAKIHPGDYSDRLRRYTTIMHNREKAGRLIVEQMEYLSTQQDFASYQKEQQMVAEFEEIIDYLNERFFKVNEHSNSQPEVRFSSYSAMKKASDTWHASLFNSKFRDEDMTYYSATPEIKSDSIEATVIATRRDLHITGSTFRNCVYSKHSDIVKGKITVVRGLIKNSGRDFVCSVKITPDGSGVIDEIKAPYNVLLTYEETETVNIALKSCDWDCLVVHADLPRHANESQRLPLNSCDFMWESANGLQILGLPADKTGAL